MIWHPLLTLIGFALLSGPPENHWAFQPVAVPRVPRTRNTDWVRCPIDAFILARIEAAGIEPAPEASREELIRRITFDLTGLPPTLVEIDAFLADTGPDAWGRVVERLLASPHYGERWARHWLDLARYAESNGYEFDEPRPEAWRYRDYVVRALNEDRRFDRFAKEQIAGDRLWPDSPDALTATGFCLLGPDMTDSSDQPLRRHNTLVDMTDTTSLVFLGLTLGCARCHDHKFEPLPQRDYYALLAFFAPAELRRDLVVATNDERERHGAHLAAWRARAEPLETQVHAIEDPVRQRLRERKLAGIAEEAQIAHRTPAVERTAKQRDVVEQTERLIAVGDAEVRAALDEAAKKQRRDLERDLRALDALRPPPLPVAAGLREKESAPRGTPFLERGVLTAARDLVEPGFPGVVSPKSAAGLRREDLAAWIAGPRNPLTARVAANRIWARHFGRGIVATTSDFGVRGERPTHPELLDWLAAEFVESGWSQKQLHRLILTSATYRQSTRASATALERDPENRLLSCMRRKRLEGEAVRDAVLAASGLLVEYRGGPSVVPPLTGGLEVPAAVWPVTKERSQHFRRSLYTFQRRNLRHPLLAALDPPDTNQSCPERNQTVTAPQSLALLHDELVAEAAKVFALRVERETPDPAARIRRAFRLAFARDPSATEFTAAQTFLDASPLSELCRALFNTNEFVSID